MNDLEAIARGLHLSVESLKRPADLLNQGYDPSFLATYRPDELGQLDVKTLAKVKRALEYQKSVSAYRVKLREQATAEGWWVDSLQKLIDNSQSVAEIDGLTRNIRSRKSSRILAEKDPKLAKLGQAILTMTGSAPEDLLAWVATETGVTPDQAEQTLHQTKNWLAVLLSEDAQLLHQLGRQILRRGQVSMKMLAEPSEKEQALKDSAEASQASEDSRDEPLDAHSDSSSEAHERESVADAVASAEASDSPERVASSEEPSDESVLAETSTDAVSDDVSETAVNEAPVVDSVEASIISAAESATDSATDSATGVKEKTELDLAPADPLLAAFPSAAPGKARLFKGKSSKGSATPGSKGASKASAKPLTPRQRRRKWLRSILQRYSKLRKPLTRLGHYEALMLGRGQRSQIIAMRIEYDLSSMTKLAHDALCSNGHPMEAFLSEVADNSLSKIILPRLEHDVFSELEESAHHELTEHAVRHLQEMIDQRPVRGHRILLIDAMGPKSAAVAIVDPRGHVDFTGELSSVSSRSDVVTQNVATLGEWIHTYKVSLVAISNGNTRRYLIQTVAELMKQSGEGGDLRWTIVDRTGADAYCETRQALQELPTISRRHRAAVWLTWRLQDPLIEITKVDPARLRLGSYQRELPQDTLEIALGEAVSSSVAARGVDVWNSHEKSLVCLPGVDLPVARAIVDLRDRSEVSTREKLAESLTAIATETQLRQAIGYLRIFESEQPLDGTMIHPDDYRLAERLVATGELQMPPAAPPNWVKPTKPSANSSANSSASPSAKSESDANADLNAETNASDPSSAPATNDAVTNEVATAATDTTPESDVAVAISEPVLGEPAVSESISQESAQVATPNESNSSETESAAPSASLDTTTTSEVVPDAFDPDAIPSFATPKSESDSSADSSLPKQNAAPKPAPILVLAPTNPENPDGPAIPTSLTIDVEKLSRSWQVGREKTRFVGRSLQQPFADSRDFRMPIPLLTSMPTMETLRPGQTVWGIVIGVADFGAFMDLGPDCNGLVHVSRLSREFVEDPQEVVQIGDLIQVWVLHVDLDKRRIALSALPPGVEQSRRPGSFEASRDDNRRDGRSDGNNRGQPQAGRYASGNRSSDNRSSGNRSGSQPVGAQQGQSPNQQSGGQQSGGQQSGGQQSGGQQSGSQRPSGGFGGNRGSGPGNSGGPPRSGQSSGQGQGANRGGQGGGSREGYGGRGNSYRDRSDSRNEVKAFNKKQDKPSKPAPPISDAMKEGKEPMRSFSDLIQFMQPKRTEPLPSATEKSTPKNSPAITNDATNESGTSVAESIVQVESNVRPDTGVHDTGVHDTGVHDTGNVDQAVVQPAAKQVIDTAVEDVKIASEPAE